MDALRGHSIPMASPSAPREGRRAFTLQTLPAMAEDDAGAVAKGGPDGLRSSPPSRHGCRVVHDSGRHPVVPRSPAAALPDGPRFSRVDSPERLFILPILGVQRGVNLEHRPVYPGAGS